MEPTLQNKTAVKQDENNPLKWLADVSQATADGIKAVTAPGFSAASSLLGAATRACYWVAEQSWQSVYNSTLNLGDGAEAKKITETWDKLRENAPHLDRLGARVKEITEQMEALPNDSGEYAKLHRQRNEILEHYGEHVQENASSVLEIKKQHEALVRAYIKQYGDAGLSVEEIEKKVAPLCESREKLERAQKQLISAITVLDQYIEKHERQMQEGTRKSLHEYQGLVRDRGIIEDPLVVDSNQRVGEQCHNGCCKIRGHLSEAKKKLESGDIDGSALDLRGVKSEVGDYVTEIQRELSKYNETRDRSLLRAGVSREELEIFSATDNFLKQSISDFSSYVEASLKIINQNFDNLYKTIEDFGRESIQFLRMSNAAYFGGAGSSVLTLGLFDGPYAVSALSYIEQQEKLEKLAKKFQLLAPPATLQEREEYKKIS